MSAGTTLDQELNEIRARLDALEGDGPVDPPPDPGDLIPLADQQAVDRMRRGEQIQIVPRIGGWRVDYRTDSKPVEIVHSNEMPTIAQALLDIEPLPSYLKVPSAGGPLARDEQAAIADLGSMTRRGRSCSVRWEKNGTHADTNWVPKPNNTKKWKDRGLIVAPVAWLRSVW